VKKYRVQSEEVQSTENAQMSLTPCHFSRWTCRWEGGSAALSDDMGAKLDGGKTGNSHQTLTVMAGTREDATAGQGLSLSGGWTGMNRHNGDITAKAQRTQRKTADSTAKSPGAPSKTEDLLGKSNSAEVNRTYPRSRLLE
jgi:hypothetical protein